MNQSSTTDLHEQQYLHENDGTDWCPDCIHSKDHCQNIFTNFPRDTCTTAFYENVTDIIYLDKLGSAPFTLEQLHQYLKKHVYPKFEGIEDPLKLSRELLVDCLHKDLGIITASGDSLYCIT